MIRFKVLFNKNGDSTRLDIIFNRYLADPGKVRGCSTNTVTIHSFCEWVSHPLPPLALQRPQLFQSSILIMDIGLIDWISLGVNAVKIIWNALRWEGRVGVTITIFFPAYKGLTQDQLSIRQHPHKDLKWTKLCLGPIQTCLEAFLGFLGKTKKKLTQNWLL